MALCVVKWVLVGLSSLCYELACTYIRIHLSYHTAVITTPVLQSYIGFDSVARFLLTQATAERSERYISSLERTDLGVPLEVEFEETQSSGAVGDAIDRHVSAPGAEYNIKIWSINGDSFSTVPLTVGTTLLLDKGKEIARMCTVHTLVYICVAN